jgi:ATP-dependent helicase/nuclease subunit A
VTGLRILDIPEAGHRAEAVATEAEAIARFIHQAVIGGAGRWGDFLILTRKKRQLPVYARALEALKIPVEMSGGAAFAESGGVRALASLLRALSDPGDTTALVGVLRGPLFGLSDEALFRHREAGFRFLLTSPLPDEATGPVVEALRALQAMFRWTRSLPAPAAVERVLEETGLLAMAATATLGGGEAGNLLHAVDRVRQITEAGGSLADAAVALEEDINPPRLMPCRSTRTPGRGADHEPAQGQGPGGPVVFLADPLAA